MQEPIHFLELIKLLVQWGVVPVIAFVWLLHKTQQEHETEIEVMKAVAAANKEAHDREFKELRENFKGVFAKLENIEQALRK